MLHTHSFTYHPRYIVSLPVLQFSPVSIIPPTLHTHSVTYHSHYIMFLSQYFNFSLSLSFHQCSILIFNYTLLLPEGQAGEGWEPPKKRSGQHSFQKYSYFPLFAKQTIYMHPPPGTSFCRLISHVPFSGVQHAYTKAVYPWRTVVNERTASRDGAAGMPASRQHLSKTAHKPV